MSSPVFSVFEREQILERLRKETFDLLVIGGGITGAGIALDASSRGLKTALLEKSDFAFGTSGRSTKLIHGGLRYLKQFEFGLVREVGSERAVVHSLAPHLVVPEKMLLPLSEKQGTGYWLTSVGLKLYDFLAGVGPEDSRKMLSRQQTLKCEPLLKADDVNGGALYAEYRTDDARLTIEVIKAAVRYQASVLNYTTVNDFIYQGNSVAGVSVSDVLTNETFIVESKAVVSATGPWVDRLRDIDDPKSAKRLHLTKGVHIVVSHDKFPVRQAIYFNVEDGRMIFAIPRGRTTYVGTTDTTYHGDPDHVVTTAGDAQYLLNAVNATFPSVGLVPADIESSWAGLRPLIREEGKSASELSRKDEIFESPSGLISIAGGKLTGYRKMAERVVNLVIKKYFPDRTFKPCHTAKIRLPGGDFRNQRDIVRYRQQVAGVLAARGLGDVAATYLVEHYGRQTDEILTALSSLGLGDPPDLALLKAEFQFSFRHEMVASLQDFFMRRTGLIYFDMAKTRRWKDAIAVMFRDVLGWDEAKYKAELEALDRQIREITGFR